jgi:hypothetical protein
MKLFILKLLSLVVFVVGLVSLAVALGLPEVKACLAQAPTLIAELQAKLPVELDFLKEVLTVQGLWFTGSIVAIVFGVYGFAPRSTKWRKPKKISYEGPHGEVQIQLDTVEHSLNHVLARMPEIKRINVKVDPQDGGRRALIRAEVVLYQRPGQNARALASLVTDYIAETASKLLGLEDLATIELKVIGIVVNSKKSSKAIRKESLSHSANAPVELLEAAPAPLTLSGPREPIGGAHLEEEFEDSQSHTLDAEAVDTRDEVSSQAAARSELLEPLSVGKPLSNQHSTFHEEGASERLGESQASPVEVTREIELAEEHDASELVSATHASDVLEVPVVQDGDTHFTELEGDGHDDSYRVDPTTDDGDNGDDEGLDDDPAYGGTPAEEAGDAVEVEEDPSLDTTPFSDAHLENAEDDEAQSGFHAGEAVDQPGEFQTEEGDGQPGEVTIPEGEDDPNATGQEKKRWGWFN